MTGLSAIVRQLVEAKEKATPGKWLKIVDPNDEYGIYPDTPHGKFLAKVDKEGNATIIIAAVNAIPTLASAVERLEKLAEKYQTAGASNRVDARFGNKAAASFAKLYLQFAAELRAVLGGQP